MVKLNNHNFLYSTVVTPTEPEGLEFSSTNSKYMIATHMGRGCYREFGIGAFLFCI